MDPKDRIITGLHCILNINMQRLTKACICSLPSCVTLLDSKTLCTYGIEIVFKEGIEGIIFNMSFCSQ